MLLNLIEMNRHVYENCEAYQRIIGRINRSKERKYEQLNLATFISDLLSSFKCYSTSLEESKRSMSFKEDDVRAMLCMLQMENVIHVIDGIIYLNPPPITEAL
jgi:hypothetical protein